MENKARKMFAAVVVIMLCVVAIVGVGYAYTASTKNASNSVGTEYIKLKQSGSGAYTFASGASNVYYNTVNETDDTTFTYQLYGGTYNTIVTGATVVKIGETINIVPEQVGATPSDITCTFTTTNFSLNGDWKLYIVINNTDSTVVKTLTGNNVWDNNSFTIVYSDSSYKTLSVEVYYGLEGDNPTTSTVPLEHPLSGASITFTATKGVLLNKDSITLTAGGSTETLEFSLQGVTQSAVEWTSSAPSYATVDNGTVTSVAEGSSLITVKVRGTDGLDYYDTCVVTVTAATS